MNMWLWGLIFVLLAGPLGAAPTTQRTGGRWILENKALRVEIDAQKARYQVLDKQAGYIWRGPQEGIVSASLVIPQAPQPLPLENAFRGWAQRGALIELTPKMLTEGRTPDSAADCSARVRVLWNADGLYLAVEVQDDKIVFPTLEEAKWWEKDSIEFWIDATQYAVRLRETGANLWSSGGGTPEAQIWPQKRPDGYAVVLRLPPQIVSAVKSGVGARFRFAIGVNDCDGAGRKTQLYYPLGWAHSNPATFAEAILANAQGEIPAAPVAAAPTWEPAGDRPGEASFKLQIRSGNRTFPGTITFRLLGDTPDLQIVLDTEDRDIQTGRFGVLHPLVLDRPGGRILAPHYGNGIGVPTEDMSWRGRNLHTYGVLDMPWLGLTDGKIGYMLLWELPVSCDNGVGILEAVKIGEEQRLAPTPQHDPIRGRFGAPRVIRYSFCAEGGHVAICKRFRAYIKEQGFFVTQKEKMRRKPHLARLLGAPDIWGRSDLRFAQEAKAAGIDRMLLNGPQPAADMEKIKALGYLIGCYDNYEDAYEGDKGVYGDFVEAEDVVIMANGERMKAWLTKSDPPKQFMKRCSALYEQLARKWVPLDLEKYPYNARFIDVTTATGLRECYHERHPLDRTQDREVNRRLALYISDELNLVLGGEHGRWWGADIYNYWEGMQSGGFYSWPAGYVGMDLPKSREEIGKQYLEWGLGEKNRYPLWELVYHDCVVSTWYWGDSTGHLQAVAPELGYKQDAFNVLYGTVPLYWVNRPYSYDWSKPETRARLLESYRNTCKLHEIIGFEEMLSHEFVTEDRAVQHSVFGDGTQIWVNFGEKPWTFKRGGKSWTLPQYGFYVTGPRIEQYRALQGERIVTYIRTKEYLYASESVPGVLEFTGGGVTCKVEAPGRLRVIVAPDTAQLRLNPRQLCPGTAAGPWRMLIYGAEGEPERLLPLTASKGSALLAVPLKGEQNVTLLAPEALAKREELHWQGLQPATLPAVTQGARLSFKGVLQNIGGKPAKGLTVKLLVRSHPVREVARQTVDLPAGAIKPLAFIFDTSLYDGEVPLALEVSSPGQEVCVRDNRLAFVAIVKPDWRLWDGHIDLEAKASVAMRRPVARLAFDLAAERAKLGLPGAGDPDSLRVMLLADGSLCPTQLVPTPEGQTELLFQIPRQMQPGETLACRVYFDRAQPKRHYATGPAHWQGEQEAFDNGFYRVRFAEGYIRGVWLGPQQILANLGTSSKDTGWVDELGTVQSFEVLSDGPVCTILRVRKQQPPNHFYDKLYTFYENYFTVQVLSPEIFGTMSRAYYMVDADYEDDKGNRARIDGRGDAENVAGKNPKPLWYATWGPNWALNAIALTPFDNLWYWDGGAKGGVGFSGPQTKPGQTVAYVLHALAEGAPAATVLAQQDYAQLTNPLHISRR